MIERMFQIDDVRFIVRIAAIEPVPDAAEQAMLIMRSELRDAHGPGRISTWIVHPYGELARGLRASMSSSGIWRTLDANPDWMLAVAGWTDAPAVAYTTVTLDDWVTADRELIDSPSIEDGRSIEATLLDREVGL